MSNNPQFSRKTDEWQTPQHIFDELNDEFYFRCDVAADSNNRKCEAFISKEEDALGAFSWMNRNWCNPPYSKTKEFVSKAISEQKKGRLTVMLIPARTDTVLFHDYIYKKPGIEIRFVRGRIKFIHSDGELLRGTTMNGSNDAAPFPSMIVIFNPLTERK